MLFATLNVSIYQILWILSSVVMFITIFLVIVYSEDKEELRKTIFPAKKDLEQVLFLKKQKNEYENLSKITERLSEKKQMLKESKSQIKSVEQILNDVTRKTLSYRIRYKTLLFELKRDVLKTEDKVKTLQNQVSTLNIQRETLRDEVKKQHEVYRKELLYIIQKLERNPW